LRLGGGGEEIDHRKSDLDDSQRLDERMVEALREGLRNFYAQTLGG
jgi:hypothetical protein